MGGSYSGVMLVFSHELSFAGADVTLSSSLVFGRAVSYAMYLLYSGQLVQRIGSVHLRDDTTMPPMISANAAA